MQEARISQHKNNALEITLAALATECEERAASGKLAKDMKKMKTASLLGSLTRITAAVKQAAVFVVPQSLSQARDTTALKAQSAVGLSDYERAQRIKDAKTVDAEVIPEQAG